MTATVVTPRGRARPPRRVGASRPAHARRHRLCVTHTCVACTNPLCFFVPGEYIARSWQALRIRQLADVTGVARRCPAPRKPRGRAPHRTGRLHQLQEGGFGLLRALLDLRGAGRRVLTSAGARLAAHGSNVYWSSTWRCRCAMRERGVPESGITSWPTTSRAFPPSLTP